MESTVWLISFFIVVVVIKGSEAGNNPCYGRSCMSRRERNCNFRSVCKLEQCLQGKRQRDRVNGGISCVCRARWSGSYCQVPECRNGGTPFPPHSAKLIPCKCPLGFSGEYCDYRDCGNGEWNRTRGACECSKHWSGKLCMMPDCQNEGKLLVLDGKAGLGKCECSFWFKGHLCGVQRCLHGQFRNSNSCICDTGYEGTFCQAKACTDKGTRKHPEDTHCTCTQHWEGSRCETCHNEAINGNCCPAKLTGPLCNITIPEEEASAFKGTPPHVIVILAVFAILGTLVGFFKMFSGGSTSVRNRFSNNSDRSRSTAVVVSTKRHKPQNLELSAAKSLDGCGPDNVSTTTTPSTASIGEIDPSLLSSLQTPK